MTGCRQYFRPVFSYDDHFFQSYPPLAGDVNARLDRNDHPLLEFYRFSGGESRIFVGGQADPVTQGMTEKLSETGLPYEFPCGPVRDRGFRPRRYFFQGCELCLANGPINLSKKGAGVAEENGPGHVAAVTVQFQAHIQGDGFPGPDFPV